MAKVHPKNRNNNAASSKTSKRKNDDGEYCDGKVKRSTFGVFSHSYSLVYVFSIFLLRLFSVNVSDGSKKSGKKAKKNKRK